MDKFFIVGCPRSGTTMVQQGLNRHSSIVIPPETKYFFSFLGHSRTCQLQHLDRLNRDLKISLPEPARQIRSTDEARRFYETMAQLYVQRLHRENVVCFGEKTPEHTSHLAEIRRLFPEAKIIFLYRDGRDVALSLSQVPWMPRDLYVNFVVWLYYFRALKRAHDGAWPNIYFARYEDIVADPKKEFAGMLQFLGLPDEPAVAEGFGNLEGIPEREFTWKKRALEPITPDRVGVYRRELSAEQIDILERMGRPALSSLGYQLEGGERPLSLGFHLQLAWKLGNLLMRLPWHSLAKEFLGNSLLCSFKSLSRLRSAPAPAPAAQEDARNGVLPRLHLVKSKA